MPDPVAEHVPSDDNVTLTNKLSALTQRVTDLEQQVAAIGNLLAALQPDGSGGLALSADLKLTGGADIVFEP